MTLYDPTKPVYIIKVWHLDERKRKGAMFYSTGTGPWTPNWRCEKAKLYAEKKYAEKAMEHLRAYGHFDVPEGFTAEIVEIRLEENT